MKKSIIKTICISALMFVCFATGIFGVCSVSMPKTMAEYYNKIGLTNLSLACNNLYYSNSTNINDQFAMFNLAVNANNNELTKAYAKKVLDNKYINEFTAFLGNQYPNNPYLQNEKNRIVENYVKALYNTKQINMAVEYAFNILMASEANENFIVAVSGIGEYYNFSSVQKNIILDKYNAMFKYFTEEATGLNKGIAAVRLSELLEVILRFSNGETYVNDFNLIKSELQNW